MTKEIYTLPTMASRPGFWPRLWWLVALLIVMVPLMTVVFAWRMILPPPDCGQPADVARSGAVAQFCFPLLRPLYGQGTITAGPDGNVWFMEERKIARITPTGVLKEFPVQFPIGSIVSGPDSHLWFTEMAPQGGDKLVRMSPHGDIKEVAENQIDTPAALSVGPDGNLWVGEARSITRVTLAGEITRFSLPSPDQALPGAEHGFGVTDLVPGSDGNLWFVENVAFTDSPTIQGTLLGRLTPSGAITEFPVAFDHGPAPSLGGGIGWRRDALASGPDGNLWLLGYGGQMSRITPTGALTRFQIPELSAQEILAITAGPDGNLWFSTDAGKIGRMTPGGTVTFFPLPPHARVGGLTSGPDGRIWFLRSDNDLSGSIWWVQIGRITP